MIERTLFTSDHDAFRDAFRRFVDKEVAPFHEAWEEAGYVDRALWHKAGVGQQPAISPLTFMAGPGGQPLPPAPVSTKQ